MLRSINPYTNEIVATFDEEPDVKARITLATKAYNSWKTKSIEDRKSAILAFANILENKKHELARIITLEMGKLLKESVAEIQKCIVTARFYVDHADEYLKPITVLSTYPKSYYTFEPIGPILAIMPWNFPFWQALRFAMPNILLGNTVILKHASNVLWSGQEIEKAFIESGFPDGIFQTVNVNSKNIESIISDTRIKGVTLTGSAQAGSSVASLAGKYLKKSVLELGGSDPYIVLRDADIQKAAELAVKSRFQNSGQTCIAAKRWIVEKSIYEEFKDLVLKRIANLVPNDPLNENTTLAPVARQDLAETLDAQVKYLINSGAKPLLNSHRENCLLEPQVLEVSRELAKNYHEEVFGPVGFLMKANDEMEAINIANETPFGLGASLWTKDIEHGEKLMGLIQTGSVFLNNMVRSEGPIPFGGTSESGYGRELGSYGMQEFSNIKSYALKF